MNCIVDMCPLTKFEGGPNLLHKVDDDVGIYSDCSTREMLNTLYVWRGQVHKREFLWIIVTDFYRLSSISFLWPNQQCQNYERKLNAVTPNGEKLLTELYRYLVHQHILGSVTFYIFLLFIPVLLCCTLDFLLDL